MCLEVVTGPHVSIIGVTIDALALDLRSGACRPGKALFYVGGAHSVFSLSQSVITTTEDVVAIGPWSLAYARFGTRRRRTELARPPTRCSLGPPILRSRPPAARRPEQVVLPRPAAPDRCTYRAPRAPWR